MRGGGTQTGSWLRVLAQLISFMTVTTSQIYQKDVCDGAEQISLQCEDDHVITMVTASYGRMQQSRCILVNEEIGCMNDVMFLLDRWCSGQSSCEKSLPNTELTEANQNCWKALRAYLDVTYTCIKVIPGLQMGCIAKSPVTLTDTEGFISSHVTDTTGCGASPSPWRLQAMAGQTFQLKLFDFGAESFRRESNTTDHGSAPTRPLYGYITDGVRQSQQAFYGSGDRERDLFVSSSNVVEIQVAPLSGRNVNFIIQYKALGCPELKPPAHAWYKRDGSQAVIGCEWSQTTWHLSCDGHRWSGVVGNCSEPVTQGTTARRQEVTEEYPLALLLTCVVSVAVVLVVILMVICVVCLKKQRIRQHVAKKMVAAPGHYDLDPSIEMGSILFFPNKPCDCPEPQPLVPLVDLGEQDPEQGQGQECNPLHIWEQPLPELPPKTKRKSTTDSTMGTRTGRTPGDGDEHVSDVMEGDVRSLNSEPFSTQSSHKYSPLERN